VIFVDNGFYTIANYQCSECGKSLIWERTSFEEKERLRLFHRQDGCSRSGKRYLAPIQSLPELTEASEVPPKTAV